MAFDFSAPTGHAAGGTDGTTWRDRIPPDPAADGGRAWPGPTGPTASQGETQRDREAAGELATIMRGLFQPRLALPIASAEVHAAITEHDGGLSRAAADALAFGTAAYPSPDTGAAPVADPEASNAAVDARELLALLEAEGPDTLVVPPRVVWRLMALALGRPSAVFGGGSGCPAWDRPERRRRPMGGWRVSRLWRRRRTPTACAGCRRSRPSG